MEVLEKIVYSSDHLNSELIQELIIFAKKQKTIDKKDLELWNKAIDTVWRCLDKGFSKTDDQLLCSTCFFSIVSISDMEHEYLVKTKHIIDKELLLKSNQSESSETLKALSLMYGMFQSTFLTQNLVKELLAEILKSVFQLLILMAYEYSQHTFIAVKTISNFKKVLGTDYQCIVYNDKNQIVLLNMLNHNWENPITGIRGLLRGIFHTLLTLVNNDLYQIILRDLSSFYWNKAKYLMLTEIVEHSHENIFKLTFDNNLVDGLIYSLNKTGLVSAGTDLYYSVLKKINSEDEWCSLFLKNIIDIHNGYSYKAIENFNNYWCLKTFEKFPSIMNILLHEMGNVIDTEIKLYSLLFVIKQGGKLSILPNTNIGDWILIGLQHRNTQVRIVSFDIVTTICGKISNHDIKYMKYSLILEYIKDNINSDSTILRINLLKSLNTFLTHLHISFKNRKDTIQDDEDGWTVSTPGFCYNLLILVEKQLSFDGNYQRKITSVKLLNTIIDCLSEIPRKNKKQTRETEQSLFEYLLLDKSYKGHLSRIRFPEILLKLLKDPSDDIRENVLTLVIKHFPSELIKPQPEGTSLYSVLVQDALQCRQSKFFYDIKCSQIMFKLIVHLLAKHEIKDTVFENVNDVFMYSYNELLTEYQMGKDLLTSINNGKQLHSYINILHVVLDVCLTNSYKIDVPNDLLNTLLIILEDVANQFTWDNSPTSSDFSKMNVMVESIIAKSAGMADEKDESRISDLHSIVLNCLWLNVKASCDLAALLIQFNSNDEEKCTKCLTIITNVLETCRHKGAIEAAGAALGKSIKYLTTLPERSDVSKLPQTLLINKLNIFTLEASKMASVTRRGAGLSILVHRIVSCDMRKGKPLFHYFMRNILETCKNTENLPTAQDITDIENQLDLPKAILIHFLTKIVTDSSLASDVMFYLADLAELAFSNLTCPHWQIRNAALQLYGALTPRFIGQNKASGTDEETVATVGYDEFRTHSPRLWKFITEQLNYETDDKIVTHSNLIPTLNLLANIAMRYNFSFDLKEQAPHDAELIKSLFKILDSPIHTVRRLTAKCIFSIFPFIRIYDFLLKSNYSSENYLHGSLLVVNHLCHYYEKQDIYNAQLRYLKTQFTRILKIKKHSYWSREVLENIQEFGKSYNSEDIQKIFTELDANSPGSFLWVNRCIENCLKSSNWSKTIEITKILLKQNEYELYCTFLFKKIERDENIPAEVLKQMSNILLSFEKRFCSTMIWKILYTICKRIEITDINVTGLITESNIDENSYRLRYILPLIASQFTKLDHINQQRVQEIVFKMSDFVISDVDVRYISALCNNEIGKVFKTLSHDSKINAIKTAVLLLQDEDEEIRNEAVQFYLNMMNLKDSVHPNICLNKILDFKFLLHKVFDDFEGFEKLCETLMQLLSRNDNYSAKDSCNPFANDSKNIYIEVNVLKPIISNFLYKLENGKILISYVVGIRV